MFCCIRWLLPIIGDSWFLQGLIINITFTIGSIPFTKRTIKKIFKNLKNERIKSAENELLIPCSQKMIAEMYIHRDYFENQRFILASKYNLKISDIYNDEEVFGKNLINTIMDNNLIDNCTKEKISFIIRNNKIFKNLEYSDEERNSSKNNNNQVKDDIEISIIEECNISKFTLIITLLIFVFLLFITSTAQVLYNAYGANVIIFIDTIIIMVTMIPILISGFFHYESFNKQSKKFFHLFLIILLLNITNFIIIVSILLKN